jgi:hypothetical protein
MSVTPSWEESLVSFQRFIEGQGFSTELVWIFREDVTNCHRRYWVRTPVPASNAALAREQFEAGRRRGLGVTLEVLCRLEGRSACFVWVPEDEEAASYAMQGPLKFKVPVEAVDAIPVRWSWLWAARCWLNQWRRCVTFAELLPSRSG